MKISKFIIAAFAALSLTSCLGDTDNDQYYFAQLSDCINYVEDATTGEAYALTNAKYNIEINITKSTATLIIDGIQVTPGGAAYAIKLEQVPCTYAQDGSVTISLPSYQNASISLSNFYFSMRQRYMGMEYIPVFDIRYTVNANYNVRTFQNAICYFGNTSVSIKGSGASSTTDLTYYMLTFDKKTIKGTAINANLYIYSAKFAEKMPEMDIMMFNIPANLHYDGYTLAAETVKVYTGNSSSPVEQPDYGVTNLVGTGVITSGLTLNFTAAGIFDLSANLGYTFTQGIIDKNS